MVERTTEEKVDYLIKQNDLVVEWIKEFLLQLPKLKPLVN